MTYDLTIERLFDAPPELVFDTIVDPEAQREIFNGQVPGWVLWESELDLRVGGEWKQVFGPEDRSGVPDRIHSVFTEIDRPRLIAYRSSMFVGEWGRTVEFTETITFEDKDGKTLLTIVMSGLESEEVRDALMGGVPGYVDALQRAVDSRVTDRAG